jgi:uncharacterized protein YutE (UPF0331/DUF86 family)
MTTETEITKQIVRYRNGILHKLDKQIFSRFFDKPVDDFTDFEKGYEAGLADARKDVHEFIIK